MTLQRILRSRFAARSAALGAALAGVAAWPAAADPIRHPTAIFAGLDKITGRIINFDIAMDETVQFGTLQVTPHVCNTRPQTEAPQTTTFVEVDEQAALADEKRDPNGNAKTEPKYEIKRIFSGWMFSASPGLHGIEHPVYDVWLVDCKGGKEIVAQQPETPPAASAAPPETKRSGRTRKVVPTTPGSPEAQSIGPAEDPVFDAAPGGENAAAGPSQPQKPKSRKKQKTQTPGQQDGPQARPPAGPQGRGPFGLF
jgi:hypothetical protein